MSVRLRLQRHGTRNRPFYRVVAADQRAMRDGRYIELLGSYDPVMQPHKVEIDLERVDYWVSAGAQMSDTVRSLVKQVRKRAAT